MGVRVKICGITSVEDALLAIDAGADALGFIFYPPSPRFVQTDTVRTIVEHLPPFVARVGVFVDAGEAEIRETALASRLDTIQLHGKEPADLCRRLSPFSVVKAFRIDREESLEATKDYRPWTWLLDTFMPGALGGTGYSFDWGLARLAVERGGRVILAGGLTPENVAQAVAIVSPYAVDVSSGVEMKPGIKDPAKVRAFVARAKSTSMGS